MRSGRADYQRALSIMIALSAGFLVPLHFLALANLLFGVPVARAWIIVAPLLGVSLVGFSLRPLAANAALPSPGAWPRSTQAIVGLAVFPYLLFLANSLVSFPNGYDAISYHLNLALGWLQSGNLRINPDLGWRYALPGNAELPALFALAAGVSKLAAFGNLFAASLLAVSTYAVAYHLTGASEPSLFSAAAAVSIPMFIFQAADLYVELFGAAFVLAAVALLISGEPRSLSHRFLAGYAIGVAVGSKPVFWIYGALVAILAAAVILRGQRRGAQFIVLTSGMALGCGYWFLRAGLATGNPLYPMPIPEALPFDTLTARQPMVWIGGLIAAAGVVLAIRSGKRPRLILASIAALAVVGLWITRAKPAPAPANDYPSNSSGYSVRTLTGNTYVAHGPAALLILDRLWSEETFLPDVPVGPDRGTGPLLPAVVIPGVIFLMAQSLRRKSAPGARTLLLGILLSTFAWFAGLAQIPRFAMPIMALACAAAAPMFEALRAGARSALVALLLAGLSIIVLFSSSVPAHVLLMRHTLHDWSRSTYYGYPPLIDQLPAGTAVIDDADISSSFALAGANLSNRVLPEGSWIEEGYLVRSGPEDLEDKQLVQRGMKLVYKGTPASLYPRMEQQWRVYRVGH